jgi:transposase
VKALKQYANDNNIDLGDAKKKADIVNILESKFINKNEEDVQMEENTNLMENEMEVNKEVDTTVPETTETAGAAADKKVWHNAKGDEVSMSEFIREQFTVNNLSRKDISEKFDINYRTVYGATVNMTNDAEPSSRGRGVTNPKIKVTADNKVLIEKTEGEGDAAVTKYFLNGEELVAGEGGVVELPETVETDRNSWIKDQVAAGVSRGDIAKILDISYGVVYGMTKEEEGTRQKYEVEYEENGETKHMARTEYIRKRVAEGVSRADVAKELGVEYSVVWQATKKDKTDEEKYEGLVEQLEKMADKINDKEGFIAAIEILKGFAVVEETKDNAEGTEETKVEGAEA